jgi:hypothetical protein
LVAGLAVAWLLAVLPLAAGLLAVGVLVPVVLQPVKAIIRVAAVAAADL